MPRGQPTCHPPKPSFSKVTKATVLLARFWRVAVKAGTDAGRDRRFGGLGAWICAKGRATTCGFSAGLAQMTRKSDYSGAALPASVPYASRLPAGLISAWYSCGVKLRVGGRVPQICARSPADALRCEGTWHATGGGSTHPGGSGSIACQRAAREPSTSASSSHRGESAPLSP